MLYQISTIYKYNHNEYIGSQTSFEINYIGINTRLVFKQNNSPTQALGWAVSVRITKGLSSFMHILRSYLGSVTMLGFSSIGHP